MEILIDNRQNKRRILQEKIQQTAQVVLSALDCPDGELSIVVVDDLEIEALNKRYLNRLGLTNVIAFPMREGKFSNITPWLLGDVVISVEAAMREGELAKISIEDRFDQLLIHGILHLFGYDHEKSKEEADKMEKKSNELLGVLSNKC